MKLKNPKILQLLFTLIIIVFHIQLSAHVLTPEETTWVENHPVIEIGIGESWAPFIYPDENGNHRGFDVDLIERINSLAGINIKLVPGPWKEIVTRAQAHEIDGLASSSTISSRKEFFLFTDPYNVQLYALVSKPGSLDKISSLEELKGKTLAQLDGNLWVDKIARHLDNVEIINTDSELEAFNLVMQNKADAAFITLGMYPEYRKTYMDNIQIVYIFSESQFKLDLVYSIRKDWPELVSIINKALAQIGKKEKNDLYEKWFGISLMEYSPSSQLTEAEQNWIYDHPVIRIAPDPEFPPIEYFDENDQYKGIAADYMEIISENLGLTFDVVKCKTWDEVLQKALDREVDLLPAAAQTPGRGEFMLFSEPHLIFPGVILTQNRNRNLSNTAELNGKKVAIVSGYLWEEFVSRDYPEINIIPVKNITEGLRAVSLGNVDAFIVTLPIALHFIQEEGIQNLTVAGETEYFTRLSILTRKDWPLLNSIISKTLQNIPQAKKDKIYSKWIYLKPPSIFQTMTFWIILLSIITISFAIILTIFLWNKALKKKVRLKTQELQNDIARRKKLETELAASEAKYKEYIDNAPNGIVITDASGKALMVNAAACKMSGYSKSELLKMYIFDVLSPAYKEYGKKQFATVNAIGNASAEVELLTKSGAPRFFILNAVRISDDRILIFANDITDNKRSELELEKYRNNLEDLVAERTRELEDKNKKLEEFNKLFVGREFRIKELKSKLEKMEEEVKK